ncbi:MAG: inovirus Gp2 family protein [Oxalobacter formigenes]|nr:inovirus Gp2 family protein [Oxalobacter formigenes]
MNSSYLSSGYDHVASFDYQNDPLADSKRRAADKRLASATRHLNDLFSGKARLMMVKVVLWYERPVVDIPRVDAMHDFEGLWCRIDCHPRLQDYLGYIWKLEYGHERGTHFYLLLSYDGSRYCKDDYFALEVKRLWEEAVATNAFGIQDSYSQVSRSGSGFVCNLQKDSYYSPALGVIHRDDALAREGLRHMAAYLSKHDELIGYISQRGERNFGVKYRRRAG